MTINFQPKIIIGSLIGFLASAIGIIAIFFPSLFNLEKKDIISYHQTLYNQDDFANLVDFLQKHQEEIVDLDLTYFEKNRCFYKSSYDYSNGKMGEYSFNKNKLEEDGDGEEGKELIGELDSKGNIIISSNYILGSYMQSFSRTNGGIGIWIKSQGEGIESRFNDKNYVIDIPKESDGNNLYKWKMKDYAHKEEMNLSGIFFIEKFKSNLEYDKKSNATMSHEWEEESCDGDICAPITVIELNPISKKELKFKNY